MWENINRLVCGLLFKLLFSEIERSNRKEWRLECIEVIEENLPVVSRKRFCFNRYSERHRGSGIFQTLGLGYEGLCDSIKLKKYKRTIKSKESETITVKETVFTKRERTDGRYVC